MKYDIAETIGRECGLTKPSEFVNNIGMHAINTFAYDVIEEELKELYNDAISRGIRFSNFCSHAIRPEDSKDEFCVTCKKLQELEKGETK